MADQAYQDKNKKSKAKLTIKNAQKNANVTSKNREFSKQNEATRFNIKQLQL